MHNSKYDYLYLLMFNENKSHGCVWLGYMEYSDL